jgi:hypothetical protein
VGCDDALYGGTVGFVNSKPFYLGAAESPDDSDFHYNNNALTFLNVGKSMGDQMILAINDMAYCEGFVAVPEESERAHTISVYPNPASHTLLVDVHAPLGANASIKMFDPAGRMVCEQRQLNARTILDVSTYAKGVYVLEYTADGQAVRQRVVVE